MCRAKVRFLRQEESQILTSHPILEQSYFGWFLDLKTLSFKTFLKKKFLRCSEACILSNDVLFGKPSKDKVEMNEREMKSLKNLSKYLVWVFGVEEKKSGEKKPS